MVAVVFGFALYQIRQYYEIKKKVEEYNKFQEQFQNMNYRKVLKKAGPQSLPEAELIKTLRYNPTQTEAIERFASVIQGTQCAFAKKSLIWSTDTWDQNKSIDENVARDIDVLKVFLKEGARLGLDGFLIEIRGEKLVNSVEAWGESVRLALSAISSRNEDKYDCMTKSYIDKPGWAFEFCKEPVFVTTFAPFYPSDNARYQFDAPKDSAYILLQPEFSFMLHNIGMDTAQTNWENPQTIRDRIRIDYKKAGRPYEIPDTIHYSSAIGVVPPINLGEPQPQWWKRPVANVSHVSTEDAAKKTSQKNEHQKKKD